MIPFMNWNTPEIPDPHQNFSILMLNSNLSKSDPPRALQNHAILLSTNIKKSGADLGFLMYLVT